MYNHPPFRRAYFRAVENAVNKAFVQSKYEAVMDAKYNSLVANGITTCDGQALVAPTAVKTWFSDRRTFLVNQLNAVAANFAITSNGGNDFTTNGTAITLTGTAPITVRGIRVNGMDYPITWTSVTAWSLRIPVTNGINSSHTAALRWLRATASPRSPIRIAVTSTADTASPVGRVVFNEIMYNPVISGAEFVEIHNTSATRRLTFRDGKSMESILSLRAARSSSPARSSLLRRTATHLPLPMAGQTAWRENLPANSTAAVRRSR
jgi:hypothetical protein